MQDDPGDDEVDSTSDLSDDEDGGDEEEDDEEEEEEEEEDAAGEDVDETNVMDEDAAGEADDIEVKAGGQDDNEEQEDDDDSSSDEDSDIPGSGAATPDPTKMTKRQRRAFEGEEFMALEMGPQQRKVSTEILTKSTADIDSSSRTRRKP
jgi:hypothetical protein